MKTTKPVSAPVFALCEITQADYRIDAVRAYLAVIVQDQEGTEYCRNFEPDANDDRILEDFAKDWRTWRVI